MEVYLVRHTETVCEKGICYGQADVGLKEPFMEQFETIRAAIPDAAIIYSSPLQRCTVLADYLSDTGYQTDPRLMEMNFGDWEMKAWDAIPPGEINPWMNDFVNVKVSNGESFTELYARVVDFLVTKLQSDQSAPVVLVTHAGVIRSILCNTSNLPLKDAFQNKVDFGEVIRIEL
jgi:alpha-ribazole phosphatase